MNKIIKFRAWNKHTERIYSWGEIENSSDNYLKENFNGLKKSGYILMQFTGFKDTKGVEIYEGDIVKTSNKRIFEVEIPNIFYKLADGCWSTEAHFKVIGNIYENPKLLFKIKD